MSIHRPLSRDGRPRVEGARADVGGVAWVRAHGPRGPGTKGRLPARGTCWTPPVIVGLVSRSLLDASWRGSPSSADIRTSVRLLIDEGRRVCTSGDHQSARLREWQTKVPSSGPKPPGIRRRAAIGSPPGATTATPSPWRNAPQGDGEPEVPSGRRSPDQRPGLRGVEGRPRASARSGCARSTGWHWHAGWRRNSPGL
jgi:hypothetical protein